MRTLSKLFRAVSVLALGAAALGFSATRADAKPHQGHGHGHGRPVCRHAYVARPAYVIARPVYVAPPAYVVVRPAYVPPPPVLYAPVPVYDRHRDGIDGFIGISGPHVSIGIGF